MPAEGTDLTTWTPDWRKGYTMNTPDDKLIYPGKEYQNAYELFNGFGQVGIPFMDGFEIQVVDDENEDGTENICFKDVVAAVTVSIIATF